MNCVTKNNTGEIKNKIKWETLDDAIAVAKRMNIKPNRKQKVVAYKCPLCHKYHVGKNGYTIKDKDKERIKKYIKNE